MQTTCRPFSLALAKTGKITAARRAMIAITTKSSMRVKPYVEVTPHQVLSFPVGGWVSLCQISPEITAITSRTAEIQSHEAGARPFFCGI